jgi:enoyl-CoA hydratase|tara:strand:- start:8846 stop:9622 length:777 start_codon:yes stop_codon:yes gene_type:complete
MDYKNILQKCINKICYITINRPKYLNALNNLTIKELSHALDSISKNNTIRCVVITGAENKAFVAGADIKEFSSFNKTQGSQLSKDGHEKLFNIIENLSIPCIAAINGFALGGGLELAMACHIRVASINAKLGLPEVSLGIIPGYGGTQRLPNLVGKGIAMEMIMTAKMISAEEANKIGLVNHVCKQEDLLNICTGIAEKIKRNSSSAISLAIKSINSCYKTGVNGYDVEIELFGKCFETNDFTEGTNAFIEKRKPNFN